MQPDELSSEAQRSTPRMTGEEEKAISSFEEAFRRIKEATGVTDIQVWMWKGKDWLYQLCILTHTLYIMFTCMFFFLHVCRR